MQENKPKIAASKSMIFYCREGYEADLAAELDMLSAKENLYGYAQFIPKSTLVHYHFYAELSQAQMRSAIALDDLIFARTRLINFDSLTFSNPHDRVSSVLEYLRENSLLLDGMFGDVFAEHPDHEEGKQLAKFCKKFLVPLRQAMRKQGSLSAKPNTGLPYLHLYFTQSNECLVNISVPKNRNSEPMGIMRLKSPADAPSRSTLKLEEAIRLFLTKQDQVNCFQKGMTAVDLGACPGGWTYQLVIRGIKVEAIDNGEMADSLMATGMVDYHAADGFVYQPKDGHVDWLVCDMIEKPERVAKLMQTWLLKRLTTSCIFNLKLPMKRRFQIVDELLNEIKSSLEKQQIDFKMQAKHLYHDRDEISVIIRTSTHLS